MVIHDNYVAEPWKATTEYRFLFKWFYVKIFPRKKKPRVEAFPFPINEKLQFLISNLQLTENDVQ